MSATMGLNDGGSSAITIVMLLSDVDDVAGSLVSVVSVGCGDDPHAVSTRLMMTVKVRKSNVRFLVNIDPPADFWIL